MASKVALAEHEDSENVLRVFLHGIDTEEVTDALDSLRLSHALDICKDVHSADAIMALRGHVRQVRACFEGAIFNSTKVC